MLLETPDLVGVSPLPFGHKYLILNGLLVDMGAKYFFLKDLDANISSQRS